MANKAPNITKFEHWQQWLQVCTVQKCTQEAQEAFSKLAYLRYRKHLFNKLEKKGFHKNQWSSDIRDLHTPLDTDHDTTGVHPCWLDIEADQYGLHGRPKRLGQAKGDWSDPEKTYKKSLAETARSKSCPQKARNALEGRLSGRIRTRARKLRHASLASYRDLSIDNPDENSLHSISSDHLVMADTPLDADLTLNKISASDPTSIKIARQFLETIDHKNIAILQQFHQQKELNDPVFLQSISLKASATYERKDKILKELRAFISKHSDCREDTLSLIHTIHLLLEADFLPESDATPSIGNDTTS